MTPKTLDEWLAYCAAMHPSEIDLSLERVVEVRARLGISFSVPVVTVAGTNGKGSTCAMLESIALQAGYRVGLYAKPHLVHFEERLRLIGVPHGRCAGPPGGGSLRPRSKRRVARVTHRSR